MIFKNYYKILGLTKNTKSTQEEIKSAYREQAKKYHPDVNVNNKNAEERFKDINEAYRTLSDPMQKKSMIDLGIITLVKSCKKLIRTIKK